MPVISCVGTVVVAREVRVVLGDQIDTTLHVAIVVVLIGERSGLINADSMGIYLTWQPQVGYNDAQRNYISNIRLVDSTAPARPTSLLNGLPRRHGWVRVRRSSTLTIVSTATQRSVTFGYHVRLLIVA